MRLVNIMAKCCCKTVDSKSTLNFKSRLSVSTYATAVVTMAVDAIAISLCASTVSNLALCVR